MQNQFEGMPLGFGMALAQNAKALEAFAALPEAERQAFIENARRASSKAEMRKYVDEIAGRNAAV